MSATNLSANVASREGGILSTRSIGLLAIVSSIALFDAPSRLSPDYCLHCTALHSHREAGGLQDFFAHFLSLNSHPI